MTEYSCESLQIETVDDHKLALSSIEEILNILPEKWILTLLPEKINPKESVLKNIISEELRLYEMLHELICGHLKDLKLNLMGKKK